MLTELLNYLKERKTYSLQELAIMLKTNIPAVKAQLEYLERLGYIKKVVMNTDCSKSCKGCSRKVPAPVMWELTPGSIFEQSKGKAGAEYITVGMALTANWMLPVIVVLGIVGAINRHLSKERDAKP